MTTTRIKYTVKVRYDDGTTQTARFADRDHAWSFMRYVDTDVDGASAGFPEYVR